ncbi:YbhB/YbcL family Raf kinase inhibitor-like protein [Nocardia donostiensis]|nr:YbhB/YbcL family Raf kinase inhibitor-like protein [Nocardia donostiensis]
MPKPGSHHYDVRRTRLRAEYDDRGVPDQHADRAANAELQQENPPVAMGDPDRAAGPRGTRGTSRGDPDIDESPAATSGSPIELRSAAFHEHTLIPERYAYDGENISPPLEWGGIPDGTREIALLCEDPDAPTGTFTHWAVTGIAPDATGVDTGALPAGSVVGRNDFGELGWSGPRPPVGDEAHRYFFRLYAVDRPLGMPEGSEPGEVRAALTGHITATGTLVGLFGR